MLAFVTDFPRKQEIIVINNQRDERKEKKKKTRNSHNREKVECPGNPLNH
jgi:hypothetical protein